MERQIMVHCDRCVCLRMYQKSSKPPSLYDRQTPCRISQAPSFHFKTNQLVTLALVSHSVIVIISRIQPKPTIHHVRRSIRHLPLRASPTSDTSHVSAGHSQVAYLSHDLRHAPSAHRDCSLEYAISVVRAPTIQLY